MTAEGVAAAAGMSDAEKEAAAAAWKESCTPPLELVVQVHRCAHQRTQTRANISVVHGLFVCVFVFCLCVCRVVGLGLLSIGVTPSRCSDLIRLLPTQNGGGADPFSQALPLLKLK